MKSTLLYTFLLLALLLPFVLRDGKRYRVMLLSIILLLPFFQVYIYFRYMILIYAFIMIWLGDDKQVIRYTKEPVNKCMIVFFIIGILSAFTSADLTRTLTPLTDLVFFYLLFLICSVAISRHLTSPLLPTIILWGLLSSVFIQTMQLYGAESFYIYDEESLNMNTGLAYTNDDKVIRYWGPFGNSLTFSSYLSIFGLFLFSYYHSNPQKRTRFLGYVVLSIALYGVLLTAGRTALVAMVVGLLFYAFAKNWKKAIVVSAILVVVAITSSALIDQLLSGTTLGMYSRFTSLGDDKSYRTETWVRALPVLLNNPLFGTGPGNLQTQIAPLIRSIIVNEKQAMDLPWGHVENTYLSVLYTFGIAGFSCFLYMIGKSFLYSYRALKGDVPPPVRRMAYGLTTAWVVMGVNMIANPVFVTDYRLIALMLLFVAMSVQVGWFFTRRRRPSDGVPFTAKPVPTLHQPIQLA